MKKFLMTTIRSSLRLMAILVLKRHRPIVIGITGSVGKSSTKEAITTVLSSRFRVRQSPGNFNNEIGVPLAVLGSLDTKRSRFRLAIAPIRFISAMCCPRSRYPEILVLELGIDRVGDMEYLLSFLSPTIGVLTTISTSHLEFFKSVSVISREKGKLLFSLPKDGLAILNADEPRVMKFRDKVKSGTISYGFGEDADVRGTHLTISRDPSSRSIGSSLKLEFSGKSIPVRLPNIVAKHHVSAALAAVAVGIHFKINPLEAAEALRDFRPLPGRMRLLCGTRDSLLVDDTYNSSPKSLSAALETLKNLEGKRRIVVLGDMLELGSDSEKSHRDAARWILEARVDEVFLLGNEMRFAEEELDRVGFLPERTHWFSDPESLGFRLVESVRSGDVVLFKGSQGMRLEKAVELSLADPSSARELLCRQSEEWKNTPFRSDKSSASS